jgi:hypothetical protein
MRNPWRRYNEKMPPTGEEFWSEMEYWIRDNLTLTLRCSVKTKEMNKKAEGGESRNTERQQVNIRGQIDSEWTDWVKSRVRFENIKIHYPTLSIREDGWLTLGGLKIEPFKGISVENRLILFRTDSYDTRIYEYENDLAGVMTNVGLFEKGIRWYALVKGAIGRHLQVSLKYSITHLHENRKDEDRHFGCQVEFNPTF